ncbi:flippase [Pseudomonadales bacterium]|nr:flippase [Pseudomonadales bacterium]
MSLTFVRQLLAAMAQFLLVVTIARELGPEGNGFYALAILVPTMLVSVLNLGVGPATVYHISRKSFDPYQAKKFNIKLALMVIALGLIIIIPLLLLWGDELFPGIPLLYLLIGVASFPIAILLGFLNSILQGLEDFKAFNLMILLPSYVNLVFVVIALVVLRLGVAGALAGYFVGQFVGLAAVMIFLRRYSPSHQKGSLDESDSGYVRKTLSYGLRAHLSNILAFVNYRADLFLVNFFLNPAAAGVYVIAIQIAEKLWMVSQAASTVLLPRLSAMHDDSEARLKLANKGFWLVSVVTIILSVLVGLLLYFFLEPIFGESYVNALPVFFWLLPGIIAGAGARIYANCIAAAGKPEWNMYASFLVVTVNVICNIVLIPEHGLLGAACATSIAYCLNALIKFSLVKRTLHLTSRQ